MLEKILESSKCVEQTPAYKMGRTCEICVNFQHGDCYGDSPYNRFVCSAAGGLPAFELGDINKA